MNELFEESKFCGNICEVIQVLGSKWAFAVITILKKEPKRFNQLQREITLIKTQSLTNTLRKLEQNGFVQREIFNTVPVTVEYSLTEKGMDFQTVLNEMQRWVSKWGKEQYK
ncbi:transcriptional regulator [Bacillus haynesii]|uniref:Transcriptional regulator n=1 Tax=Bacillus haynesii TaxID=1925021 RepID=A0ABX3HXC1_9BACI|nr:helix-turn-helix domain-containing protein [Bacillus haynesii]OMI24532.1 transcriptional regulator [Bacillus haynesii]